MDGSLFYGARKTHLLAVVPRYADDSDNDMADPNYTPNTTDATAVDDCRGG